MLLLLLLPPSDFPLGHDIFYTSNIKLVYVEYLISNSKYIIHTYVQGFSLGMAVLQHYGYCSNIKLILQITSQVIKTLYVWNMCMHFESYL